MIIVDDHVSIALLGGRSIPELAGEPMATTWGFHFRLLRALASEEQTGALSRRAVEGIRSLAASPPPELLRILDPRELTVQAARIASRQRTNQLTAELVAAAIVHQAPVATAARNAGRSWPQIFSDEGGLLVVLSEI